MTVTPGEISVREKIAYGCGDLSSNLMWGLTSSWLMFYYTDVYGLPASDVAWILLIARVFDAFCDPAIGYVIDRAGGMIVPRVIRLLAIPFGVSAFLCFLPLPLSPHGKILWAGTSYILFGAVYSCINTPYGALATMISTVAQDRVDLNTFRMMGCQLGQFSVALLTIPAISWLGGGDTMTQRQTGMALYVLILSVIGSALWEAVSRVCVVRHPPPPVRHSPAELFGTLFWNQLWHICNALVFLQFVGIATFYGFAIYYARVLLGGSDSFGGELLTIATVSAFFGACLSPLSVRHLGVTGTCSVSLILQILGYGLIWLAGAGMTTFFAGFLLLSLSQGVASPLYYVLLAAAIDKGFALSSVNTAGLAYSISTLMTKLSMGVTGFLLAFFLSWGHYTPASVTQSPDLAPWVTAGFIWLPLGGAILQLGLLRLWPRQTPERNKNVFITP